MGHWGKSDARASDDSVSDKLLERVHRRLEEFIGPHTTRLAIKTFSQKTLGMTPDQLRDREVPDLIRALRPLLRSMLGETQGEQVVEQLLSECKS
jgi:hypothetical protein